MKDLYIRVKYLDKETGKVRCYTKTLKNMFLSKEHSIYGMLIWRDPAPVIKLRTAWKGKFEKGNAKELSNSKNLELSYFEPFGSNQYEQVDVRSIRGNLIEIIETIVERR